MNSYGFSKSDCYFWNTLFFYQIYNKYVLWFNARAREITLKHFKKSTFTKIKKKLKPSLISKLLTTNRLQGFFIRVKNKSQCPLQFGMQTIPQTCALNMFVQKKTYKKDRFLLVFIFRVQTTDRTLNTSTPHSTFKPTCMQDKLCWKSNIFFAFKTTFKTPEISFKCFTI